MTDTPQYDRRSIRLKGFDYSQPGSYFVTICTHGKKRILSRIENDHVILNPAGEAVRRVWLDPDWRFPSVAFLDFVIMPNHFHGIIRIMTPSPSRGAASSAPTSCAITLGKIVRAFKSLSALEVNCTLGRTGEPVWQRNYWDHVIRSAKEHRAVRVYIKQNPPRWERDPENV
ncbi:MAG: transposase [Candidatus Acidiferrales bacterium]